MITVAAWASVPAYSSKIRSGPSHSIQTSFSHIGHGSARCQATRSDERSYPSRTSSGRRQIRFIIVGTRYTTSARCSSIAANVPSASNRGSTTTWLPVSSAWHDQTAGPLWYSGPGITRHPSNDIANGGGASVSIIDGSPDTISFGRPVEPPDVGAFQAGDTASGSGPSSRSSGDRYPSGRQIGPSIAPGSTPTATLEPARATISCSSRAGNLADTGCGTAPSFQQAT